MSNQIQSQLAGLAAKWPSNIVARSEIGKFTGGTLKERTMANLDSDKKGPGGRFYIGRKVVYPVAELISWLEARSLPVGEKV